MIRSDFRCDDPRDGSEPDAVEDCVDVYGDDGYVGGCDDCSGCVDSGVSADPEHHEGLAEAAVDETFFAAEGFDCEE